MEWYLARLDGAPGMVYYIYVVGGTRLQCCVGASACVCIMIYLSGARYGTCS